MFCKHCGEKIEEGAINCTKCGKPTKKIDINKFNKILDFIKSKKIPLACVGIILIIEKAFSELRIKSICSFGIRIPIYS